MGGANTQTSAGRLEGFLGDCEATMNEHKSTRRHSDETQEPDAGYTMQDA